MVAIRSTREIAEKWSTVTPTRTGFYEAGVRAPKKDWARATSNAEGTYKEAVTRAAAEGRFGKGVQRLLALGLCGLDHERLAHDQGEIDRGRMEAEIHQPLGHVHCVHAGG